MRTTRTILRQASDWVNASAIAACAALLAAMLMISAIGITLDLVKMAYAAFGWGDPLVDGVGGWLYANSRASVVRVFLPWLGMLSITVAFKYCEHVAIDLFSSSLPPALLAAVKTVNFVAIAAFGGLLAWYGLELFTVSNRSTIVSSSLIISQRWMVAAVPVAGIVICLHLADGFRLLDERNAAKSELDAGDLAEGRESVAEARP